MKRKNKNSSKVFWYTLAVGVIIIFAVILISSALSIGERIRAISIYLEIVFYVALILVVYFAIIRPIVVIVKSPSLSIVTSMDGTSRKTIKIYKKVAKRIVKYNDLPNDQVLLLTKYRNNEELLVNISYVFGKTISPNLNKIILNNAKTVLLSTAICQSSRFDMLTVFAINLRMIKELVLACGFRPSMKNLSKLTVNVFATALIAEGLGNLKLEDIMPKTTLNLVSEIPLLGKGLDSLVDGVANALLSIRIGCVARRYLYSDGDVVTKESIRNAAYKEALLIIPQVLADTVSFFPKKIINFFTKKTEN